MNPIHIMSYKGQGGAVTMLFNIPWWIYLIIMFIIFSGYMSYRAMRVEKILEQHYIEREGQIYMERIRQERHRKQHASSE